MSHNPETIFAIVLQLAGAIKNRSAQRASLTWLFHLTLLLSKKSNVTSFKESVDNVNGLTNWVAEGVKIIFTSAPFFTNNLTSSGILYAAILPETPINILLPNKIDLEDFLFIIS